MASLATFERALIAERVKACVARAKAQGKHVGRSRIPAQRETAIRRDVLAGRSLRSTIKAHGVGSKTVQRLKAELAEKQRGLEDDAGGRAFMSAFGYSPPFRA